MITHLVALLISMSKRHWVLLFLAIFAIRLLFGLYIASIMRCLYPDQSELLHIPAGDTPGYILPWENLIKHGTYSLDGQTPYADRMPYVGFLYFVFLLFVDKALALNLVSLVQIIYSSYAILVLAILFYRLEIQSSPLISRTRIAFLSLIFCIFSLYLVYYDIMVRAESIATSSLIIFSYFYLEYMHKRSEFTLLWSGLFMALAVLWRPPLLLLYVPIILELLIQQIRNPSGRSLRLFYHSILVLAPFIILNSPWIIRNLITFSKFIPFQSKIYIDFYAKVSRSYMEFVRSIGETLVYWEPDGFSCYFLFMDRSDKPIKCSYELPSRILGANLTREKIEKARYLYAEYKRHPEELLIERITIYTFDKMRKSYIEDHPYTFWIVPRIYLIKRFLIHSGVTDLPLYKESTCNTPLEYYLIKTPLALFYQLMILGFIGLIIMTMDSIKNYFFSARSGISHHNISYILHV